MFTLDPSQDGIEQITQTLAKYENIAAIHILSHGSPGTIYLGNSQLNLDTLSQYRAQLQTWNASEILLYGCNVASGDAGTEFINKLHTITKASIAATQTLTGNSELGGNWDLEVRLGEIHSESAIAPETRRVYTGVLATYTVNTLQDENDGISVNNVSLRDAIGAANANPGADTIIFDPIVTNGVIPLNAGLGITDDLTITGDGTIRISGRDTHRPFTVANSSRVINVTLDQLQIIDGRVNGSVGGGIYNEENLTITDSTIANNLAVGPSNTNWGFGGGIYNVGRLAIINSNISNNTVADGQRALGAGIFSYGTFFIVNSTISNNINSAPEGRGAGIFYENNSLSTIINSTINNNSSQGTAGIDNRGNLQIINSTISRNTARGIQNLNQLSIFNSTITDNIADGVVSIDGGSVVTQVTNSIIAGNNNGEDVLSGDNNNTFFSRGGNLIGGGNAVGAFTTSTDQTGITNPQLGPLANNGGPTLTHALLANSSAIDAGFDVAIPTDSFDIDGDGNTSERLPLDQRGLGFLRVIGSAVDAGAIEFQSDTTTVFVTLSPTSVIEDGSANLVYTFTRRGDTSTPLNVGFNVGGSATFNSDYTQSGADSFSASSGSINFGPNQATKTITIDPTRDTNVESNESVALTVISGTGYTVVSPSTASGTITDDDAAVVSISVSPTSVTEDGSANIVYTFTRTGVISNPLNDVRFNVGGTATFNNDYTQSGASSFSGSSGRINFSANQATKTVTINPNQDTTVEPNETVALTLVNGSTYSVANPTIATGTITNDDATLSLTLAPTSVTEDGSTNLVYTFRRTGNTSTPLSNVRFSVSGTATLNNDYVQNGAASFTGGSGSINFGANQATKTVTLNPTADTRVEPDETLRLALISGTGYTLAGTTSATGTIRNDDTSANRLLALINPEIGMSI
ncbi:DUF4347 domain-containing protein [Gloeocapsa sp. PCC 73106]|uniref:DUF4347 domain-containing protein n=1 Tax=Gloeocapsa sp. PCC 73106 TaxID=102232 RepID=UPI0002AC1416|nr:DUF4347 domain-containing protein [Gloeocapsa sp. PCC 73106]ELR99104.1 hypothetical protein GLO73106DRAFT_00029500 [Gloeocapsa sp. PCC 73106]